jgi:hypothetical protein
MTALTIIVIIGLFLITWVGLGITYSKIFDDPEDKIKGGWGGD